MQHHLLPAKEKSQDSQTRFSLLRCSASFCPCHHTHRLQQLTSRWFTCQPSLPIAESPKRCCPGCHRCSSPRPYDASLERPPLASYLLSYRLQNCCLTWRCLNGCAKTHLFREAFNVWFTCDNQEFYFLFFFFSFSFIRYY